MKKMSAYVDSFKEITILLDKKLVKENNEFFITINNESIKLEPLYDYEEYNHHKYVVKFNNLIKLHLEYEIKDSYNNKCILRSGSVVRSREFDELYKYDGPLGFEYHKEYTIFRVWSPVAKEIKLELIKEDKNEFYSFKYIDSGLWEVAVFEDLEMVGYVLHSRVFDKFERILDPYAISSSVNAKYNYVVDINKFYKMKYDKPYFSGISTDAIIYEASIRDFTYNLTNDNKETFLGMVDDKLTLKKQPKGLDYIKSLGITHLQLLPTYDFDGVDDIEKSKQYNWGYNPLQYFVPCGWYSKNPNDPYSRINELLELIDECHKRGLRVVMDVVFNHVYKWEEFAFDHLVPGYFYRVDIDGSLSNATGCGNVVASERYMTSRFIIDVLKYYTKIFNVCGFRFDLMGLLDINTLNKAYEETKKIENGIIMYGEGWNMNNPLPDELRAHMYNHHKMPNYGFFNDKFRDTLRGNQWDGSHGFALGSGTSVFDMAHLLGGSCVDYFKFDSPCQSINYVECHDNYTFFDYALKKGFSEKQIKELEKLATQVIIISQGVPFIHAGMEFFRTKNGVENSYNAKDSINKFDYLRRDNNLDNIETIKDLIAIRKEYSVFRLNNSKDIYYRVHNLEGLCDSHHTTLLLQDDKFDLILIAKNNYSTMEFNYDLEMIYNSYRRVSIKNNQFKLSNPGVYIFKKEK